jgi:hypothetical protein
VLNATHSLKKRTLIRLFFFAAAKQSKSKLTVAHTVSHTAAKQKQSKANNDSRHRKSKA